MERFNAHIRAANASLQEAPEVFETVGVHATIDVLNRMVNNLMGIFPSQSAVGEKGIGVERRASFNMLFNFSLQGCAFPIRHNCCANLAAALQRCP